MCMCVYPELLRELLWYSVFSTLHFAADAKPFGEEWREKTHSLNRASSLVLPIEQSRRNQFSDRRGLPCPQHPGNMYMYVWSTCVCIYIGSHCHMHTS